MPFLNLVVIFRFIHQNLAILQTFHLNHHQKWPYTMVIPLNPVIKLDVKLAIANKKSTMNESMYIYFHIFPIEHQRFSGFSRQKFNSQILTLAEEAQRQTLWSNQAWLTLGRVAICQGIRTDSWLFLQKTQTCIHSSSKGFLCLVIPISSFIMWIRAYVYIFET